MSAVIRLIYPSGRPVGDHLAKHMTYLERQGFTLLFDPVPYEGHHDWPYTSAPLPTRILLLKQAFEEKESDIILCARGGYGCSDLFPYLPWEKFKELPPKLLIGFSDISALQSAVLARLGWPSLHAPMPGSALWGKNSMQDIEQLVEVMSEGDGEKRGAFDLEPVFDDERSKVAGLPSSEGWLFGGCMSVLTNLIGTPYFPKSLAGSLLFFEDTGENPGRLQRHWNQWIQAGLLRDVKGVVWGDLSHCSGGDDQQDMFKEHLSKSCDLPCWKTRSFGHLSPNMPVMMGGQAFIDRNQTLEWRCSIK